MENFGNAKGWLGFSLALVNKPDFATSKSSINKGAE
jgi:hypothetical protein